MLFGAVRCYLVWCGVVGDGSGSYGMIRCSTGRFGEVRGGTGWYGVVHGSTGWYRIVRGSTERSNKSRIGYPVYLTCQWWYLGVEEYNINVLKKVVINA